MLLNLLRLLNLQRILRQSIHYHHLLLELLQLQALLLPSLQARLLQILLQPQSHQLQLLQSPQNLQNHHKLLLQLLVHLRLLQFLHLHQLQQIHLHLIQQNLLLRRFHHHQILQFLLYYHLHIFQQNLQLLHSCRNHRGMDLQLLLQKSFHHKVLQMDILLLSQYFLVHNKVLLVYKLLHKLHQMVQKLKPQEVLHLVQKLYFQTLHMIHLLHQ